MNKIKINKFFILYGFVKKIKKFKNIIFVELISNFKKKNFFIKNNTIKIFNTIIGIYGINNLESFIFELCYFKKKINKINLKFVKIKSKIIYFIRFFFYKINYFEIDIPLIEKFTEEGSKQFLVIDKNKKKSFFCLSQSPQKVKQYYMFNFINKYFQIAKCFRDEDSRSNRLKEFQQIDIENSNILFIDFSKIINLFLKSIFYYILNIKIFFLKIKYKYIKKLLFEKKNLNLPYLYLKIFLINTYIYIYKSFFFKNFSKKKFFFFKFKKYFIILSKKKKDYNLCLIIKFLNKYYNILNLKIIIIWIINFYFYKNKKIKHHQFTAFKNNFLNIFDSKSLAYDIVLNGIEIGGGSIRNINFKIQNKILKKIQKKSKFINFYKRGIPHHCGIALGLERIISIITRQNIKKTISYGNYLPLINSVKINE